MNDEQLLRYSRQIMLPQIDVAGQQRLLHSKVLIMGLGGLGSPVAMYLAAAGVGHLVLNDHDKVELSNLQRQIIHDTTSLNQRKTESAKAALSRLNSEVVVSCIDHKVGPEELEALVTAADAVVDGTDNFNSRFAINSACVKTKTPLISGAVIRMEGQVGVFRPDRANSPCYRCLYQDEDELAQTCSENGVLAPVAGIIGSIQATETIKVLLDIGETLTGRLLLLDAMTMEWRSIKLKKDSDCPVCGSD